MNPEFKRNLWLEFTPARLLLMAGFVLFLIATFSAAPSGFPGPASIALALYYFLVVLWGARNAALSVITEIRERTWDAQKLSAVPPFAMVWGKLFGATSLLWFGGLICLPFIVYPVLESEGLRAASGELAVLVLQGVLAQSVSLLTSLNLVRRQHNYWRLDAFLCQVMGIVAAFSIYGFSSLLSTGPLAQAESLSWWGIILKPRTFQFFSLLVFTLWALVGCTRAMRIELRFANGPFVWLAFLAFLALYDAGFDIWFGFGDLAAHAAIVRFAIADLALAGSAYGMAFLEPKDPVHFRWLIAEARSGRIGNAFMALDCWMLSLGATILCAIVLMLVLGHDPRPIMGQPASSLILPVLAALGFFTRDIALFLFFRTWSRERGDFMAIAALAILYAVLPEIPGVLHPGTRAFLLPQTELPLLGVCVAWGEAIILWAWTTNRMEKPKWSIFA